MTAAESGRELPVTAAKAFESSGPPQHSHSYSRAPSPPSVTGLVTPASLSNSWPLQPFRAESLRH